MGATVLVALFLASAINAALPGPCVFLTMGRTAGAGWRAGTAVSLGVAAANLLLVVVATAMMVGALALSDSALAVMKWAGVAALVALAARSLRPAASPHGVARLEARDGAAGFAAGLSSPYNLVFYLALLPQFLPLARPDPDMVTLATMCVVILTGVAVAQGGAVFLGLGCSGAGGRWADRACAVALLAFAAAAAAAPAGAPEPDATDRLEATALTPVSVR